MLVSFVTPLTDGSLAKGDMVASAGATVSRWPEACYYVTSADELMLRFIRQYLSNRAQTVGGTQGFLDQLKKELMTIQ